MSNSPESFFTRSMSPMRTSREGFACWPFDEILPSSQARAASERVLKNRAAQSHLSILTGMIHSYLTRNTVTRLQSRDDFGSHVRDDRRGSRAHSPDCASHTRAHIAKL